MAVVMQSKLRDSLMTWFFPINMAKGKASQPYKSVFIETFTGGRLSDRDPGVTRARDAIPAQCKDCEIDRTGGCDRD